MIPFRFPKERNPLCTAEKQQHRESSIDSKIIYLRQAVRQAVLQPVFSVGCQSAVFGWLFVGCLLAVGRLSVGCFGWLFVGCSQAVFGCPVGC